MAGRFIKLYDKILQWEWYSDINTFRLFIHLLLKANYKDASFEGHMIRRGQLVTSLPKLAAGTALSERQVRVSLEHLKMTGEVTSKAYPKYRVITIVRYDDYQSNDRQNDRQMTGETSAKRQADDSLDVSKYRNIEQIEEDRNIDPPTVERSAKRFTPPTQEEIESFCREQGLSVDAGRFVDYYNANGWMIGRSHMKDWKATVRNWARRDQERPRPQQQAPVQQPNKVVAQQYEQRSYATEDEDAFQRMLMMGGF